MQISEVSKKGVSWVNIVKPTDEKLAELKKEYKFHKLDIEDCLAKVQRSKIEIYPEYLFVVFKFLYFVKNNGYVQREIDFFITEDKLITVLRKKNVFISKLQKKVEKMKKLEINNPAYLFYFIIKEYYVYLNRLLSQLENDIDIVEDNIFNGNERDMVETISKLKRNIINIRRIIQPQIEVVFALEERELGIFGRSLEIYFSDAADILNKIWHTLGNQKETIDALQETNESLISNKTNDIVKVLTLFSAILLPLSVVTGFYGMNIATLPLAKHQWSFWLLLLIMFLIIVFMILLFKKKKWF